MRKKCNELIKQLEIFRDILLEGRPVETKYFTDGFFDYIESLAKNCNCIEQELRNIISDLSSRLETHPHDLAKDVQKIIDIINNDCI